MTFMQVSASEPTDFQRFLEKASAGLHILFDETDGISKIAELACDIFSMHRSMQSLFQISRYVADITAFGSLLMRVRDWACVDGSGRRIWQRSWHVIMSTTALTCGNIISSINFVFRTGVARLGAVVPMLGSVGSACYMAFHTVDCISQGAAIYQSSQKIAQLAQVRLAWEHLQPHFRLGPLQINPLQPSPLIDNAVFTRLIEKWRGVHGNGEQDKNDVMQYLRSRVEICDIEIQNEKEKRYKAGVLLAVNIGNMVLYSIGFVLAAFTSPAIALGYAVVALSITTHVVDIIASLCDAYFARHVVPPVPAYLLR